MRAGVILYGPPGAGKDTVTQQLMDLDERYRHFQRLKVGPGRRAGYRIATADHVEGLRNAGQVFWENQRYGATYVIDAPALEEALERSWPVVHLGQPEAVHRLTALPGVLWLVVELWCPRDVAATRLIGRGTGDAPQRLEVWDETPHLTHTDLLIDTSTSAPAMAARQIDASLRESITPRRDA